MSNNETTIKIGAKSLKSVINPTDTIPEKPKNHEGEDGWILVGSYEDYQKSKYWSWNPQAKTLEKLANSIVKKPKKRKKDENVKLAVTNYDNFKNASFFISQYYKAQDMLEEVQKFFEAFTLSKIFTIDQIDNMKFKSIDVGEWIEHVDDNKFRGRMTDTNRHSEVSNFYNSKSYYYVNPKLKEEELKKLADEVLANKKLRSDKFGCYWVIDKNGVLHDFIPIAAKDSIKVDFSPKAIVISGKYYKYSDFGGRWGVCNYNKYEISVKIVMNPENNNIEGVVRSDKIIEEGEVAGKNYWSHHSSYCMPCLHGDNAYQTGY